MDKEIIFKTFFKCNSDGLQKFQDYSKITHAGIRIIFIVIHLALGGNPSMTLQWLKDENIISDLKYDRTSVFEVLSNWKKSSDEVFLINHRINDGIKSLKCNTSEGLLQSDNRILFYTKTRTA